MTDENDNGKPDVDAILLELAEVFIDIFDAAHEPERVKAMCLRGLEALGAKVEISGEGD
jgi:hypothetical protein